MRRLLKRAGGMAIIGLGATLLPVLAASPASAAPGAQPPPTVTPNPVALAADNFDLSNGSCDGTGGAGWRVQTFIVNDGVNVGTLVFDQGPTFDRVGADRDNSNGSIASPLWKDNAPGTGYNPAASPPGLIDPAFLQSFDFSNAGWVLTDGAYQIGYACIDPAGATSQWWARTVTVDTTPGGGSSFMVMGAPAPAPTISSVTVAPGALTIDFTGTGADSWTAQASTVSGDFSAGNLVGTSTTATNDTTNITISGLTNGTPYFVRVLANKAGFGPVPSAQSGPHSPNTNGGAVQNLAVTDSGTDDGAGLTYVDVDWNAPATVPGCTLSASDPYTVTVSPSGTPVEPDPDYAGANSNSARVTGVPTNTNVTITVTPNFGAGCTGTAASVPAFVATGNVVIQDIDVTRPIGALVLTQICGTNGALPGEGRDSTGTPFNNTFNPAPGSDTGADDTPGASANDLGTSVLGFGRNGALPPIAQVNPSTVGDPAVDAPGGAPSLIVDPAGGTPSDQAAASDDSAFAAYPYPTNGSGVASPAAETHCGLDLGAAKFVTQGAGAGQYFAADAAMNQVTIVDTRNVDQGWNVTGEMADFVATVGSDDGSGFDGPLGEGTGGADTFSGDFLGWTPVVTEDTSGFDHDADAGTAPYDQQAVAGGRVSPNTIGGLGDGATLAMAEEGEGLGTAILDGRIKLLIPVNADAGLYEGALRFSAL